MSPVWTNNNCKKNFKYLNVSNRDFFNTIDDIASVVSDKELFYILRDDLLDHVLSSYFQHQNIYDFNSRFEISSDHLCNKACKRCSRGCSEEFQEKTKSKISYFASRDYKEPVPKEKLLADLNSIIDGLNNSPEKFKKYLLSPPGSLLLSEKVQRQMGGLNTINDSGLKKIDMETMLSAISSQNNKYLSILKELGRSSLQTSKDDIRDQLKKLLITTPALVGKNLFDYPEYAGRICQMVNEVKQDKKDMDNIYKWGKRVGLSALVIGTVLTGGALGLVVFGVGAKVTSGLLLAGSIGFGAAGVVGGGVALNKAVNNYNNSNLFERNLLLGVSDEESLTNLNYEIEQFYKHTAEAILSFGTTLVPIPFLKQLNSLDALRSFNAFLSNVLKNTNLMKILDTYKKKYGVKNTQELFVYMSKVGMERSLDLFKKLNLSQIHLKVISQQKNFWQSVDSLPRFFFKDVNHNVPSKNPVFSYLLDPLGSASKDILINYQFRDHVSLGGELALAYFVSDDLLSVSKYININNHSKNNSEIGLSKLNNYKKLLNYDDEYIQDVLIKHNEDIKQWSKNPNKFMMPLVSQLLSYNLISKEQVTLLNQIAKRALDKSLIKYKKSKSSVELDDLIIKNIRDLLELSPIFKTFPFYVKDILEDFFTPEIKISEKHSNFSLLISLIDYLAQEKPSLIVNDDFRRDSISEISRIYRNSELSKEMYILLNSQALEHPKKIREKYLKMQKMIPTEKSYISLIPDYIFKESATELLNPQTNIKDDADKWNILMNDNRFSRLKRAWLAKEISDIDTYKKIDEMIDLFNSIEWFQAKWSKDKGPTDVDLQVLYNLANDDNKAHPLLVKYGQMAVDAVDNNLEVGIHPDIILQKKMKCLRQTSVHVVNNYSKIWKFAWEDTFFENRNSLMNESNSKLSQILKNCAKD